jgi:hypothetical protein
MRILFTNTGVILAQEPVLKSVETMTIFGFLSKIVFDFMPDYELSEATELDYIYNIQAG